LKSVITGDETWVYGYDTETKWQSSHWKCHTSPRPQKAQQMCSWVKAMLLVFSIIEALCVMNLQKYLLTNLHSSHLTIFWHTALQLSVSVLICEQCHMWKHFQYLVLKFGTSSFSQFCFCWESRNERYSLARTHDYNYRIMSYSLYNPTLFTK
jgi:hypothetical protein